MTDTTFAVSTIIMLLGFMAVPVVEYFVMEPPGMCEVEVYRNMVETHVWIRECKIVK